MRCRFAGADDPARRFLCRGVWLRPSVNDEKRDVSNQAHGLPSVAVWMVVKARHGERVIKNKRCRFKTEAVIPLVGPVLFVAPRPVHAIPNM